MNEIETLATEYEYLLDIRESIEELDDKDLLDKACQQVEEFRESFAAELPSILELLKGQTMVPYEAYVNYTGDVQIRVNGKVYFDFNNLYISLDNYDIVQEDSQVTVIEGAMTPKQFRQLQVANLLEINQFTRGLTEAFA